MSGLTIRASFKLG